MTPVESEAPSGLDLAAGQAGMLASIETRIRVCRGCLVLLDRDLAILHGVSVNCLLKHLAGEAVFAGEFCFELEPHELNPAVGAGTERGRAPRYAFTEHGALAVALRLNRPDSLTQAVRVLRAFLNRRKKGEAPEHFA